LVIVPFQGLARTASSSLAGWQEYWASVKSLRSENQKWRSQIELLQLHLQLLNGVQRENETLRQELAYKQTTRFDFLPARIIGRDAANWLERAVLDRGSRDGVVKGAGVLSATGVVGRILDVNLTSATVMFLPDPKSKVAAVVKRSGIPGTIGGQGKRDLRMEYVDNEDDVVAGDEVLTSNLSSLFPENLLIGTVREARASENDLKKEIVVAPVVNFKTVDHAFVLRAKE
jgi:rod shape-determining protein MreC